MGLERTSLESRSEPSGELTVQDWGLVDYQEAFKRQLDHVGLVRQELAREALIFCSHPPVVTLGRATKPGDVESWTGEVVEVNRGGRATYHGPQQIVVYPILDLNHRSRDLHKYLRSLENAVIATLADFGILANGRSMQLEVDGEGTPVEATGVWFGSRKVASIGIGVRKWITFHGIAINIDKDPDAFRGLKPCGFTPETMISVEEILGQKPEREHFKNRLMMHLRDVLKILGS